MRKLVVKMSMSLDGFVVGPDGKQDWIFRTADDESNAWEMELISRVGLHAMGSNSFLEMSPFWPSARDVFAEPMNSIPKAVFSHRTLAELTCNVGKPTDAGADAQAEPKVEPTAAALESWRHPRVLSGELSQEVRQLKAESGGDVVVYGGAHLAQSLVKTGLVDEYYLLVHPIALGRGLPLFSSLEKPADLELVYAKSFKGGTVGHLYRPKNG